jgi:hypothetical protein
LGSALVSQAGCSRCSSGEEEKADQQVKAPPSASAPTLPAPVASGLPDAEHVSSVVNPEGVAAYAGPTGTVLGRVLVTGDEAPELPDVIKQIPPGCVAARETYGRLFRVGPERGLADTLVAVTGYKGYVPEREAAQRLEAKGCSFGTRTVVLTYGQRIEVVSKDAEAYVPELLGEPGQPQLVATPGGSGISTLYPTKVGRYVLIDNLRLFMTSEVLVLKYPTHAVTGLDGRFAIPDVPVGPVVVSALHPTVGPTSGRSVVVEAGKPTEEITFEIEFDRAAHAARTADAGAARADGGAPQQSNEGEKP